jgi:hypothetical protein
MDRIRRRTWALDALAAVCLIAVVGPVASHALLRPVTVVCNQQEEPDPHGNFVMQFVLTNTSDAPIAKLDFRLADTYLDGSPLGEFSHYTFEGTVAPGATVTRSDDVPEPPHYRTLKFSKIDCTLDRVVFNDGSSWP